MNEEEQTKNIRNLTKYILTALKEGKSAPHVGPIKENVFYRRPVTIVLIQEKLGRYGVGWSKVCSPDEWDKEKGLEIARARAAQDLSAVLYNTTVSMG